MSAVSGSAIRITLLPDTLQAAPDGGPVESIITVQNTGPAVDQYAVELDGLPTTWYTLSSTAVALFPQDKDEAKLIIRPPKGPGVKAGVYPFTVTALSRADPSQTSRAEGTLQIGAVAAFDLDMSPRKVIGRKGRYNLTLRNGGNADLDVALSAQDTEEGCRYTFKPADPTLTPGQRASVRLTVRANRSGFVGQKKQYDFQVTAKPSQGEPKTIPGQLVHAPRFRTWKPMRRMTLVVILLALLAGAFTVRAQILPHIAPPLRAVCTRLHVSCTWLNTSSPVVAPPVCSHARPCGYIATFRLFHRHDPHLIGQPMQNEHRLKSGFTTQQTTTGLLIYDPTSGHAFFVPKDTSSKVYEFHAGALHEAVLQPLRSSDHLLVR